MKNLEYYKNPKVFNDRQLCQIEKCMLKGLSVEVCAKPEFNY